MFEFKLKYNVSTLKKAIEKHYRKSYKRLTRPELVGLLQALCEGYQDSFTNSIDQGVILEAELDGQAAILLVVKKNLKKAIDGAPFHILFTYKHRELILTAR